MKRPTYYLWKDNYATDTEYETAKERFLKLGFRVVTFKDGTDKQDIQNGIRAVIKNHVDNKSD